jgi:SOS response regulatory protein OraA/RecX
MGNLPPRSGRRPGAANERPSAKTSGLRKPYAPRERNPLADATRYLARSDRSVEQVRLYLGRLGYAPREIQNALTALHDYGYLGDEAVALRLAQSYLLRRPVSRNALVEVLRRRGFDRETASRAVGQAYERTSEQEVAARFLSTLPVKFKDPMRESHRRARLLLARSFSQEVIEMLLGSASADQD